VEKSFNIKVILNYFSQNALLSAVPFLCNWIYSIFYSRVLDILVQKNILTTTVARKVSMGIGELKLFDLIFSMMKVDTAVHILNLFS